VILPLLSRDTANDRKCLHIADVRRFYLWTLNATYVNHDLLFFIWVDVPPSSVSIHEDFVWKIMAQLVSALNECHCGTVMDEETQKLVPRHILHRDLKPDNGNEIKKAFLDERPMSMRDNMDI
jgi:serine/threonine protein kinase